MPIPPRSRTTISERKWVKAPVLELPAATSETSPDPGVRRDAMRAALRSIVLTDGDIYGSARNADRGSVVGYSRDTWKHPLSILPTVATMRVAENLDLVVREAKVVTSHPDEHRRHGIRRVHRLAIKIRVDGSERRVVLTVRDRAQADPALGLYHIEEWQGPRA